jgi:hypothetical protein
MFYASQTNRRIRDVQRRAAGGTTTLNQVKALAAALVVLSAPASATDLTNIENVSSLNGADINITDSIDLNQNNLNSPNKVDGIDLDNPGPGIQLNGNKLAANASKFVDRNGDTMTGDLKTTGGDILMRGGSASDPALAFNSDGDTGIYRDGANIIGLSTGASVRWRIDSFGRLDGNLENMNNGDILMNGQSITELGGTTDATSGALRLANNKIMKWRNTSDGGNIGIGLDDSNFLQIGTTNVADTSPRSIQLATSSTGRDNIRLFTGELDLTGGDIRRIGGVTDASSGAIRLANGASIQARDSGNSNDIEVIGTDSNNNVQIGSNGNLNQVQIKNARLKVSDPNGGVGGITINGDGNDPALAFRHSGGYRGFFRYSESDNRYELNDRDNNPNLLVHDSGRVSIARGKLEIPNGNLDMGNNQIKHIGSGGDTHFEEDGSLNLGGNRLKGAERWETGGSNIGIEDNSENKDIILFKDGTQNVEIPNGNLRMGTNRIKFLDKDGKFIDIPGSSTADIELRREATNSQAFIVHNAKSSSNLLKVADGGNVEIPNGNLIGSKRETATSGSDQYESQQFRLESSQWDTNNNKETSLGMRLVNQPVASARKVHQFTVRGNSGTDLFRVQETNTGGSGTNFFSSTVEIPNGSLVATGSSSAGENILDLEVSDGESLSFVEESSGAQNSVKLVGGNGRDKLRFPDGTNKLIVSENLDVSGNNINNIGTSNVDAVYDSGDDRVEIRSSGQENICIGNCGA